MQETATIEGRLKDRPFTICSNNIVILVNSEILVQ